MSKTILTIDEYRSLETRAGNMLGHDALMLRAGTAAADFIAERIPAGGRVTLLVGPGNNGGDALVAALELKKRGFATTVVLPGGRQKLLLMLQAVGPDSVSLVNPDRLPHTHAPLLSRFLFMSTAIQMTSPTPATRQKMSRKPTVVVIL